MSVSSEEMKIKLVASHQRAIDRERIETLLRILRSEAEEILRVFKAIGQEQQNKTLTDEKIAEYLAILASLGFLYTNITLAEALGGLQFDPNNPNEVKLMAQHLLEKELTDYVGKHEDKKSDDKTTGHTGLYKDLLAVLQKKNELVALNNNNNLNTPENTAKLEGEIKQLEQTLGPRLKEHTENAKYREISARAEFMQQSKIDLPKDFVDKVNNELTYGNWDGKSPIPDVNLKRRTPHDTEIRVDNLGMDLHELAGIMNQKDVKIQGHFDDAKDNPFRKIKFTIGEDEYTVMAVFKDGVFDVKPCKINQKPLVAVDFKRWMNTLVTEPTEPAEMTVAAAVADALRKLASFSLLAKVVDLEGTTLPTPNDSMGGDFGWPDGDLGSMGNFPKPSPPPKFPNKLDDDFGGSAIFHSPDEPRPLVTDPSKDDDDDGYSIFGDSDDDDEPYKLGVNKPSSPSFISSKINPLGNSGLSDPHGDPEQQNQGGFRRLKDINPIGVPVGKGDAPVVSTKLNSGSGVLKKDPTDDGPTDEAAPGSANLHKRTLPKSNNATGGSDSENDTPFSTKMGTANGSRVKPVGRFGSRGGGLETRNGSGQLPSNIGNVPNIPLTPAADPQTTHPMLNQSMNNPFAAGQFGGQNSKGSRSSGLRRGVDDSDGLSLIDALREAAAGFGVQDKNIKDLVDAAADLLQNLDPEMLKNTSVKTALQALIDAKDIPGFKLALGKLVKALGDVPGMTRLLDGLDAKSLGDAVRKLPGVGGSAGGDTIDWDVDDEESTTTQSLLAAILAMNKAVMQFKNDLGKSNRSGAATKTSPTALTDEEVVQIMTEILEKGKEVAVEIFGAPFGALKEKFEESLNIGRTEIIRITNSSIAMNEKKLFEKHISNGSANANLVVNQEGHIMLGYDKHISRKEYFRHLCYAYKNSPAYKPHPHPAPKK